MKKCEGLAERFVGNTSLLEGLINDKEKMVISSMGKYIANDTNRTGLTISKQGLCNHPN